MLKHILLAAVGCVLAVAGVGPEISSTSRKSVFLRGVPRIRQKPEFGGEACMAMALRLHGRKADQDFVFNQSGVRAESGRGCNADELAAAARRIGFDTGRFRFRVSSAADEREVQEQFEALYRDLAAGFSTVVRLRANDSERSPDAFYLVVGFDADADEIVTIDPTTGRERRWSHGDFLSRWPTRSGTGPWSIIRIRLKPTSGLKGGSGSKRGEADYAQHVIRLQKRLPSTDFTVVVQKPFVVVGDEPPATVRRRSVNTVKWAVDRIKRDYFTRDPKEIIDVWLFRDRDSYNINATRLFHSRPTTPFGYYSSTDRALVMNISTGGGTLVHEIVHPFMESNFERCPSWFNEGLASLYEQCRDKDGHIWGSTNWRLRGLQRAISSEGLPSFKTLCSTTTNQFYNQDPGTNYAQARYLCYYLQEQGLLVEYYHRFRRDVARDPTGYATLKRVLDVDDVAAFQKKWEAWVLGLRF